MPSHSLLQQFLWEELVVALAFGTPEAYNNSTRYGAGLKEARSATLTPGRAACAPTCLKALSTKRAFALSVEAEARIV